jgi:chitinase
MGLAGIMFWAPDLDDFTGALCNEGKYPLMNTAVNLIRGQTEWTTSTKPPTTTTTTTTTSAPTLAQQRRVVCYYTKSVNIKFFLEKKRIFNSSWAQYRPDGGKFLPENLDASLCTHISYAFAVLNDSKIVPFEWNDEDTQWSKGLLNFTI